MKKLQVNNFQGSNISFTEGNIKCLIEKITDERELHERPKEEAMRSPLYFVVISRLTSLDLLPIEY